MSVPIVDALTDLDPIARFRLQVLESWLPIYCNDEKRRYSQEGFREASIRVTEIDAIDCMRAIDQNVVTDLGGGRYVAPRHSAREVMFWEGLRAKSPRPITLWLEPVITFAALARLHFDYAWPKELLGTQPKTWAFDLAAHSGVDSAGYQILGEIKKTVAEAESLIADLLSLSAGHNVDSVRPNSLKKWKELLAARPPVAWVVGPGGFSKAFTVSYLGAEQAQLQPADSSVLLYRADC